MQTRLQAREPKLQKMAPDHLNGYGVEIIDEL
jgi:hypothetical protein